MIDHSQALAKRWIEKSYGIDDSGQLFYEETEMQSSDAMSTTLTIGPRIFVGDNITLTADCVIPVVGEAVGIDPHFEARLQIRF